MTEHVQHIELESGIHHYIWLDNSRDAVYEQANFYKELNAGLEQGDTVLLLMDMRQAKGAPPFRALSEVIGSSGMRKDIEYRTAYLSDEHILEVLMQNFVVSNRLSGNRGFFKSDEERQAVAWLLGESVDIDNN